MAARKGLTVVVQELLSKGASVQAVDENGTTSSSHSFYIHLYSLSFISSLYVFFILLLLII